LKKPGKGAFQVNKRKIRRIIKRRKKKILKRLEEAAKKEREKPTMTATNIQYETAERNRAISHGGIGLIHQISRKTGLIDRIDDRLELLKIHKPYHESDHVLNIAYNLICEGKVIEDIELRRNDSAFLDALGAESIPDPTTAGDFCRRFEKEEDIFTLMEVFNDTRLVVWRQQPEEFFKIARIDADGTMLATTGECKEGMDISHNGIWGYHPLVVSLANTGEPLYILNRSGNRPSHEGVVPLFDKSIELCRKAGFQKVMLRGDTDFSLTEHLDHWDKDGVTFVFGYDAMPNMVGMAGGIPAGEYGELVRRAERAIKTKPRERPENVKERIVREREFENIRIKSEDVAEFDYRPGKCKKNYRIVVVRKNLSIEKGEKVLFDKIRYFFYVTNDRNMSSTEVVREAGQRCNQENLIQQLKNGVRALHAPVNTLNANWAYMVMASLAWSLKAWAALLLPVSPRWEEKHTSEKNKLLRMEFRGFLNAFIKIPCQIVSTGRRIVYRILTWNPWQHVFYRLQYALRE